MSVNAPFPCLGDECPVCHPELKNKQDEDMLDRTTEMLMGEMEYAGLQASLWLSDTIVGPEETVSEETQRMADHWDARYRYARSVVRKRIIFLAGGKEAIVARLVDEALNTSTGTEHGEGKQG
jgi:hypothetical protein